jgi:hypothetical protein
VWVECRLHEAMKKGLKKVPKKVPDLRVKPDVRYQPHILEDVHSNQVSAIDYW